MPNPVHGTIIITSRTPVGAGFKTRPYGTRIHETRPYETRPYGTRIHETRIYGTRIHGTRIQGIRPSYGTTICTQGRMYIFVGKS
jgi:hypothetical protein